MIDFKTFVHKLSSKGFWYKVSNNEYTFANELEFERNCNVTLGTLFNDGEDEFGGEVIKLETADNPGLPDAMCLTMLDGITRLRFVEYKYTNSGKIKFQKSQIPWYRSHNGYETYLVVYSDVDKHIYRFTLKDILQYMTSTKINLKDLL